MREERLVPTLSLSSPFSASPRRRCLSMSSQVLTSLSPPHPPVGPVSPYTPTRHLGSVPLPLTNTPTSIAFSLQ